MFGRLAFLIGNSQTNLRLSFSCYCSSLLDRRSVSEALATINDLVIVVEFLSISESFAMVNE